MTDHDLLQQKKELDAALAAHPDDESAIRAFRSGCISLLKGMEPEGSGAAMLKLAVSACADCCLTRIAISRNTGSESAYPVPASEEERSFCVSVYDRCTALLRETERMYLPEPIERSAPDRQKLSWLMNRSLSDSNTARIKAQQDGKQFNRLFGSRG